MRLSDSQLNYFWYTVEQLKRHYELEHRAEAYCVQFEGMHRRRAEEASVTMQFARL
jgi:inhibitor of KinA sporulation pathway (predicted exonuclease)